MSVKSTPVDTTRPLTENEKLCFRCKMPDCIWFPKSMNAPCKHWEELKRDNIR